MGYRDPLVFAEAVLVANDVERREMLRQYYTRLDPQLSGVIPTSETKAARQPGTTSNKDKKPAGRNLGFPRG